VGNLCTTSQICRWFKRRGGCPWVAPEEPIPATGAQPLHVRPHCHNAGVRHVHRFPYVWLQAARENDMTIGRRLRGQPSRPQHNTAPTAPSRSGNKPRPAALFYRHSPTSDILFILEIHSTTMALDVNFPWMVPTGIEKGFRIVEGILVFTLNMARTQKMFLFS